MAPVNPCPSPFVGFVRRESDPCPSPVLVCFLCGVQGASFEPVPSLSCDSNGGEPPAGAGGPAGVVGVVVSVEGLYFGPVAAAEGFGELAGGGLVPCS